MTREEAIQALEIGIEMATKKFKMVPICLPLAKWGLAILRQVQPSFCIRQIDPEGNYRKGAGLGQGGLVHKIEIIQKSHCNKPTKSI